MQSISFDDYDLSSESAFNYVTDKMIEMVEQESKTVNDLSGYRWVIGYRVAKYIFPKRPTKILDYDVVYENPVKFYQNGINFEPGVVNTKNCSNCRFGNDGICPNITVCVTSSLDQSPSHWMEMTDSQKLEKEMSNTKTYKKLVGDISRGYRYVDTDTADNILITNIIKDSMIKKEDETMKPRKDYGELYLHGSLFASYSKPEIKNVIFSGPCTIVQWSDGDKTVVRCENEDFDHEKGLAMAIVKKLFGTNKTKSNYNDIFKKWIPEEEEVSKTKEPVKETVHMSVKQYTNMTGMSKSTIIRQINSGKIFGAKKDETGKWVIPVGEV